MTEGNGNLTIIDEEATAGDVRRAVAEALKDRGRVPTFVSASSEKVPYQDYLATMIWDLIIHGQAFFADGRTVQITDHDEWLATVKFLLQHVEGSVQSGVNFNGINLFKVYAGFDPNSV